MLSEVSADEEILPVASSLAKPRSSKITAAAFAAKYKSKREIYNFLTV